MAYHQHLINQVISSSMFKHYNGFRFLNTEWNRIVITEELWFFLNQFDMHYPISGLNIYNMGLQLYNVGWWYMVYIKLILLLQVYQCIWTLCTSIFNIHFSFQLNINLHVQTFWLMTYTLWLCSICIIIFPWSDCNIMGLRYINSLRPSDAYMRQ